MTDIEPGNGGIFTGITAIADLYKGTISGPMSFGFGGADLYQQCQAATWSRCTKFGNVVVVPTGYISGAALSDTATWFSTTFATLHVRPGYTYGRGEPERTRTLRFKSDRRPTSPASSTYQPAPRSRPAKALPSPDLRHWNGPETSSHPWLGPRLSQARFNTPGTLADPTWDYTTVAEPRSYLTMTGGDTQQAAILPPASRHRVARCRVAILDHFTAGEITAILSGKTGLTGVALVEVYDVRSAGVGLAELTNVSTRGLVGVISTG